MKSCLIITSCIYPSSSFVKLVNPCEREKLHVSALKRWLLESKFDTIIVCDNSNYKYSTNLIELANSLGKSLEFLSFLGNKSKCLEVGKGFGEGEIMEYVINNSIHINRFESFFKVTGKLFVENHSSFDNFKNIDFAFDFSYSFFWKNKNIQCVFTNFYYANLKSYKKYLIKEFLNVKDNDGFYLEHAYAFALQNKEVLLISPILPIVSGVGGSSGVNYSYNRKIIAILKRILLSTGLIRTFKNK